MVDETQTEPLAVWIDEISQRPEGVATARVMDLKTQCRDEFAKQRGWVVGREFSTQQLKRGTRPSRQGEYPVKRVDPMVYDHVEYFRAPKTGKPVAFITHSYSPAGDIRKAVERDGLNVEWLAVSWYYPGQCTAALVTAPRGGVRH